MRPNFLHRLQQHLADATEDVVLVAPFIKAPTMERLFSRIPSELDVTCVTRWRAEEVARGVSDLEVLDLCTRRPGTSLLLRNDLHAKYYRVDELCLVGSANLTDRGLGLGEAPNLEILIRANARHEDLAEFESDLFKDVVIATVWIREQVAEAARLLEDVSAKERKSGGSQVLSGERFSDWIPGCLVPSQLYSVYRGDRSRIADAVYRDALEDLEFLDLLPGLRADQFRSLVASRLVQHPIFTVILSEKKLSLGEHETIRALLSERLGIRSPASEDVEALRNWLSVFFPRFHAEEEGQLRAT